jgi:hypothetical protein
VRIPYKTGTDGFLTVTGDGGGGGSESGADGGNEEGEGDEGERLAVRVEAWCWGRRGEGDKAAGAAAAEPLDADRAEALWRVCLDEDAVVRFAISWVMGRHLARKER